MDEWDKIWKEKFSFKRDYKNTLETLKYYYFIDKYFKGRKGQKVLEIGCGTGLTSLILSKKYKFKPYLVDASPESVKICKKNAKRLKVKAVVKKGYAQKIPFPNGHFDVCFSGGLNEHFSGADRLKVLKEMCRVSKDLVMIIVPNAHNIPYRIGKFWREMFGKWIYGKEIPYSKQEFRKLLKECVDVKSYEIFGIKFKESLAWPLPRTDRFTKYLKGRSVLDNFGCELVLVIRKA